MLRTDLPEIVTETLPGPKAKAMIERRKNAVPSAIGCVYPVVIERGEGAMVEDVDGNKFLDWVGRRRRPEYRLLTAGDYRGGERTVGALFPWNV